MMAKAISTSIDLRYLIDEAIRTKRNRQLRQDLPLDPNGTHIVWFSMPHNDVEIRTGLHQAR